MSYYMSVSEVDNAKAVLDTLSVALANDYHISKQQYIELVDVSINILKLTKAVAEKLQKEDAI